MTIQDIINQMGIELLVFVICLYYGIRLIVTKDPGIIMKNNKDKITQKEEYAVHAGYIMLFLGLSALFMGILSFVNPLAAAIEIVISVIIMGALWKQMHEKYS